MKVLFNNVKVNLITYQYQKEGDPMKVVYYSFSGNVRRFISRAGIKDTFEMQIY